jgi:pilus assembly protein CpaF
MHVIVEDTLRHGRRWSWNSENRGFRIGRSAECRLRLESRLVSSVHAQVERGPQGWELVVLPDVNPVEVDGAGLESGQRTVLAPSAIVKIAGFVLTFEPDASDGTPSGDDAIEEVNEILGALHKAVLAGMELRGHVLTVTTRTRKDVEQVEMLVERIMVGALRERILDSPRSSVRLLTLAFQLRLTQMAYGTPVGEDVSRSAEYEDQLRPVVEESARRMGVSTHAGDRDSSLKAIDDGAGAEMERLAPSMPEPLRRYVISHLLRKLTIDTMFGLGPLQDLLDTPEVTEVMVVHPSLVYVERDGRVVRSNRTFVNDDVLVSIIERIVAPLGRRIDRSQPLVDARLPDGSRVNAVIPPLAIKGPCLTIRRFPKRRLSAEDLVVRGTLSRAALRLLQAAVRVRKNIVVAGGTGSGKTSMLNALSAMIPTTERLVTIEDAAELQLDQEHVISLETRPANAEGAGAYAIRDLVKNALRMRPDRILVGECRGAEALDMLQAMNTGHDGSMTTLHANSAGDALVRLETMVLMAVDMPIAAVRMQIVRAVDLVVFLERQSTGRRVVSEISEVMGVHPVTGEIETRPIFERPAPREASTLLATGYVPEFLPTAVIKGLITPEGWLEDSPASAEGRGA